MLRYIVNCLGESVRKLLLLFSLIIFFFACKGQNNIAHEDIGLEKLTCEDQSILERMDGNLFCNFGNVQKFSVDLMVKPVDENAVSISVETVGYAKSLGSVPYFTVYLTNGINTIRIISTSKKDVSNKKEYTIRINKRSSSVPTNESSTAKELTFDGKDVLLRMNSNNVCELQDVEENKSEAMLVVVPHNTNAEVKVLNDKENIEKTASDTYKVALKHGLNQIYIVLKSSKEGEKLYLIKVYRTEDLDLKSFNVDGEEYCNNSGEISVEYLRFPLEKANVKVSVEAKVAEAKIIFKQNGKEIRANEGFYNLDLVSGDNAVEVNVEGREGIRRKVYNVLFVRLSENALNSGIIKLVADETDLLPLMSKENSVVLSSCNNDVEKLKLKVLATSEYEAKVLCNDVDVQGSNGLYDVSLNVGKNKIVVDLIKGGETKATYSIFKTRYQQELPAGNPQNDEVKVHFVVLDGVNGSSVDGSYLNISKTANSTPETTKKVLIRNGKAEANLKKNGYYNFMIEGQNDEYSPIRYAASDVVSYYLGSAEVTVPIVQRALQRITKASKAPIIDELKFGTEALTSGEEKLINVMKDVSIKVKSVAPIRKLDFVSPLPMLGVGVVPTTGDGLQGSNIFYAKVIQDNVRNADGTYESSWKWECSEVSLIKEEYVDVVLVVYDVANNRLERHIRLKNTNAIAEDETISVDTMKLFFTRYPTTSALYSVGHDEGTKTGTYYTCELSFDVKRANASIPCKGYDLYRKCLEDGGDFALVKHIVNKTLVTAEYNAPHKIYDNDGLLEDEKTYQYKVVAYTDDEKKSTLANSNEIKVLVPKSTCLLLEYPVNNYITPTEAKNLNFDFRFSNPKALKNAKEMELGLMVADGSGACVYGSKFRYVFDEKGTPEIYFAGKNDASVYDGYYMGTGYSQKRTNLTTKPVEDLVVVDVEKGTVRITKELISLVGANIATSKPLNLKKGAFYYWDVLDWGIASDVRSDFFHATKITMKADSNVYVTVPVNDSRNGENAWNGRVQFGVKME